MLGKSFSPACLLLESLGLECFGFLNYCFRIFFILLIMTLDQVRRFSGYCDILELKPSQIEFWFITKIMSYLRRY